MLLPSNIGFQKKLIRTSVILAFIVQAITLLVLLGWTFNIDFFTHPLTGSAAMNPITALSLLFAATSFLLLYREPFFKRYTYPGRLLAVLTLLIGIVKIVDISIPLSIPIDRLLFPGKLEEGTIADGSSGNMALNSAISLVLMGMALLLMHVETIRSKMPGQFVTMLVCIASFLSILIYLYRVPDFNSSLRHIPMAIHTAICFQLLSIACLFIHPDKGMMKDFTSLYAGSVMARILIPAAMIIPVILGFIRLAIYWYGSITTELGETVLVVSIILIFLTFIRFSINILNKKDFEREQAETALKKSRQRIQELFDTSPDAAVIVDQNGLIQMVNDQAVSLFQYQRQELIGQKVDLLLPEAMQSSHEQHREQYLKNPLVRPMGVGLELQALKRDGNTFPVEISLSPLHTEDGLVVSASIRDVTERKKLEQRLKKFNEELEKQVELKTTEIKQNEEKFRTLIERISDGFLALDKHWNYTYANKQIGELTRRSPESLIGKNVWEEFPSAVGSDTYKAFLNAMNKQEYVTNTDYYSPLDLWQENHIYPSPDGISVFVKDITIKKRAEQEMLRVNEELHRLSSYLQSIREEERIHIAREIHDELGQQLTGLKMYVFNLHKHWNEPREDKEGLISDIIELTDEIVNSVRRISSNLRPAVLDDLGLVPALEWQSQEVEKRSSISVSFESELFLLDLPPDIATGLFRVYQEALNNAVKYANAKKIKGKLELTGDVLVLEIIDDGKGMNIEELKEKRTFGLLGIQERTHMMKGKYELDSKPGEGTRIRVAVPVSEIVN